MGFEYDHDKSLSNLEKHGINFDDAQDLWLDPDILEIPAKDMNEPRYLVIGKIGEKHWSTIMTYRESNIRLISVRRSREQEIEIYEST